MKQKKDEFGFAMTHRASKKHLLLVVLACVLWIAPAEGQYYFGRNKIQYNRFQWQILRTSHFEIYFYPEMDSLAEIGAYYAEQSYRELQDKFNFNILKSIPLVFYSSHFHFEETNTFPYLIPPSLGGFFEFIKGRVVVPSDGSIPHFRQIIRHELVHVFMQTYADNVLLDHRAAAQGSQVPLWFTEGLAEYWSEGWSSEAEMIIRDGVLNNTLVPVERMSAIWGTYLMYKEGQAVLKFIAERYGEEKILRLLQNLWKAGTFSEVMQITLGKNYIELSEEWMYHLKKTIYPLMNKSDFPKMVAGRITEDGFNMLPAFYREDSTRWVIFVGNRDGYSSIYRKRLNDDVKKEPEILIRGERTPELESFRLQNSKIDVDSLGRLAFVAKSGAQDILYIFDLRAKKVVLQYKWPTLVSLFSPAWSPDGKSIALSGLDKAGKNDLYLLRIESGILERLTDDFFDDADPSWSPDGRDLVFSSDCEERNGRTIHLFQYRLRDRTISRLTSGPHRDRSPIWSRDGKSIVFVSDRNEVPNVWVLEKPDSLNPAPVIKLRQVTWFSTGVFYPCWTDSSGLLFSAFENFGFQIREWSWRTANVSEWTEQPVDTAAIGLAGWAFPRIGGEFKTEKVKYRKRFSLDFAQSQVVQDPIFGTAGGGELAISDMLGNEQYYFLLYNNARTRSEFWDGFNLAATRLSLARRLNYAVGLYRFSGMYFNYYEGYYYEKRYGGFGALSYPLNKFERVETSLNLRRSEKDRLDGTVRHAFLVSGFASYTKDNSLWGSTGPLDGERINLVVGQTTDIIRGTVNFTTLMADYRQYFRIGLRMCWATRVWGQFNLGKEPLPFFMGGSWDLRGYKFWSLWNPKLAFVSNEFRFPFIDQFYLGFPFGGIGIGSIRGALFLDAGNVWNREFGDLKGAMGFGIRFQLGGYLVLRFDMGKKTDFRKIEPKTFKQFFFGWDF